MGSKGRRKRAVVVNYVPKTGWDVGFGDNPVYRSPEGTEYRVCKGRQTPDLILRTKYVDIRLREDRNG